MEKGSLKKVKYQIQNKMQSGKDLIESINIQIEMSYSVSPSLSSTLINLVKKNYCVSTLGQTLCNLTIDKI